MPSTSAVFLSSRYRQRKPASDAPELSVPQRTAHAKGVSNMREIYFLERMACGLVLPRSDSYTSLRSFASDSESARSRSQSSASSASFASGPWDTTAHASPPASEWGEEGSWALFSRMSPPPTPSLSTSELFDLMVSSPIMFVHNGNHPPTHDFDPSERTRANSPEFSRVASAKAFSPHPPSIADTDETDTPPTPPVAAAAKYDSDLADHGSHPVRPLLLPTREYSLSEIIADRRIESAPKIPMSHLVHDASRPRSRVRSR